MVWLNKFRRLPVRYGRRKDIHEAGWQPRVPACRVSMPFNDFVQRSYHHHAINSE
jgi:hypothetical protein